MTPIPTPMGNSQGREFWEIELTLDRLPRSQASTLPLFVSQVRKRGGEGSWLAPARRTSLWKRLEERDHLAKPGLASSGGGALRGMGKVSDWKETSGPFRNRFVGEGYASRIAPPTFEPPGLCPGRQEGERQMNSLTSHTHPPPFSACLWGGV